jgi:hypothetical protein
MRMWYERGFIKKPMYYELFKTLNNGSFMSGGPINAIESAKDIKLDDKLIWKFYQKYPEVKYFPA